MPVCINIEIDESVATILRRDAADHCLGLADLAARILENYAKELRDIYDFIDDDVAADEAET